MYQVLKAHPDIYFSPEKETHYFAHAYVPDENPLNDRARLARAQVHAAIDPNRNHTVGARARLLWTANYLASPIDDNWYRNLFAFRGRQTWCADFSNLTCFLDTGAWERVRSSVNELRVIYTMRDPVKRLWSHAKFHAQFTGAQDKIAHWLPEEVDAFVRRPFMWKNGEYGATVRRLKASLPEQERRFYFFETVHEDQRSWLREVEEFLGIAHHDYPDALLTRRINESVPAPMPDWFPGLFRADIERICEELTAEGLEPPESWLDHYKREGAAV